MSRYDELIATLNSFAKKTNHEPLKIGEALDTLHEEAYPFTATLITLPFLQPFPLGFFALIGSAAYLTLGWQLYQHKDTLDLPDKLRNVALKHGLRVALVSTCLTILGFVRKLAKPRLSTFVSGAASKQLGGIILMSVGILVAIPLGGIIPFKNFFPSLAVLCYCTAETEQDGIMIILAFVCLLLSVLFYAGIFYLFWKFGVATVQHYFW
jgi:hypothetical protein